MSMTEGWIPPGWLDHSGELHAVETTSTQAHLGAGAVLDVLVSGLRRVHDDAAAAGARPLAVGVGSAGVVADGIITSATDAILDWVGTDVRAAVVDAFDLPATVLNDVHAHGLGEAFYGNGQGADSMLLVAVGTGIGGAFVTGGRVLLGAHGAAGHVGHVSVPEAAGVVCPCGKTGHLEGLASGAGILRAYQRHGVPAETTHDVFARAAEGEELATNVIADCAFATGRAIGDLINVLGPTLVAVSGGLSQTGSIWWVPLHRGVRASVLPVVAPTPVVPAHRQAEGALLGAAQAALEARP